MRGTVYKFTFPNGKIYIGETIQNLSSRLSKHKSDSRILHRPLYEAINKYGWDSVKKDILFQTKEVNTTDKDKVKYLIRRLETSYIEFYHSDMGMGYNETKCKDSNTGYCLSEEHKARIKETKQSNNNAGKQIHTDEYKEHLRENIYSSRLLSDEVKEKTKLINIARCSKKCYQYALDGTLVNQYSSVSEAKRITGISNIESVCTGKRKTAGKYIWAYNRIA